MLRRFVETFLSIPAPLAVAAVFLVTAGETAFFLGLVLPLHARARRSRRTKV
jgi:hypothetical protein